LGAQYPFNINQPRCRNELKLESMEAAEQVSLLRDAIASEGNRNLRLYRRHELLCVRQPYLFRIRNSVQQKYSCHSTFCLGNASHSTASGYREKIQFVSSSINTKNSSIPTTMSLLPPPMATYPDLDAAFKAI
jgi:hypothetical protein